MINSIGSVFNWIDLFIILTFFYYLWEGRRRGFILGVIDLSGFVISFLASILLYSKLSDFLIHNWPITPSFARAISFLMIAVLSELIFSILIRLFIRLIARVVIRPALSDGEISKARSLDLVLSFVPSFFEGAVFISFVLTLILALPLSPTLKKDITSSALGSPLISNTRFIERELTTIFGGAVSETLTFLTVNPDFSSNEKLQLGFTQPEYTIDEASERTMLNLVNNEREKRGLKQLALNIKLRDLARDYGREMFEKGYFSHTDPEGRSPFDRMKERGIIFTSAGENLALSPNVSIAHDGLMNSPGHRANILSTDFGHVGIGVIDGGVYGQMFVQEFTD